MLASDRPIVLEIAWEVCQQVGGIYTVIRSKAPSFVKRLGDQYCAVGPYNPQTAPLEFEEKKADNVFSMAAQTISKTGIPAYYGTWLIPGRPQALLLDSSALAGRIAEIKYFLWQNHSISSPGDDPLFDQVIQFGFAIEKLVALLASRKQRVILQVHEWMAGSAIPEIRRLKLNTGIVFTTHATMLGRYLAQGDANVYDNLPHTDSHQEEHRFGIQHRCGLERAAAHGAHVFTTLSDITALECKYLLKREPDVLTPNGINIERPVALHEFQNLHVTYKEKINQFIIGHFFPSYTFDLDTTLYMFSAGRFEYKNKGFDLMIDALARLNQRMKASGTDKTIVAFIVTRKPYWTINPDELSNFAMMEEIRRVCEAIQKQIGDRLFHEAASGRIPELESLVDDYWWLRLKRNMFAWKTKRLPGIVTHNLKDDSTDEILAQIRYLGLFNGPDDPVKVIYHPDFVSETSPLFGMEYENFVRGCHLGVFPSCYEPWGYTPLECIVRGIPALTSDLAGFGSYVTQKISAPAERGLYVLSRRNRSFEAASQDLAERLYSFTLLERRERIILRNKAESLSDQFDWENMCANYFDAYELLTERAVF